MNGKPCVAVRSNFAEMFRTLKLFISTSIFSNTPNYRYEDLFYFFRNCYHLYPAVGANRFGEGYSAK